MQDYNLISFPRSGQHLTERLLETVCNYFNQPYSYCEFYRCCNKNPCIKKSRFMKNHDFGFELKINQNNKYIALYRSNFIHQLESYFRINFPNDKTFNYLDDHLLYSNLLEFIKIKIPLRNEFIKKWINNDNENILKINYDEIIKNPHDYLKKILMFMEINHSNEDILNILSSFEPIKYLNHLPQKLVDKIMHDLNNKPILQKGRFSKNTWNLFKNQIK